LDDLNRAVYAPLDAVFPGLLASIDVELAALAAQEADHPDADELAAPGPYYVFSRCVRRQIFELVFSGDATPAQTHGFFAWADLLAESDDWRLRSFLQTELIELIAASTHRMRFALPRLGRRALATFHRAELYWGRRHNADLIAAQLAVLVG
jgi:hypothetical protein